MRFYTGTHMPNWLALIAHPLFVSRRTLARRRKLPRALGPWALDSGGFTQLAQFGAWEYTMRRPLLYTASDLPTTPSGREMTLADSVSPRMYAAEVRRYRDEIGQLDWAAIQDWMCEPSILKQTGSTIAKHQQWTIDNYAELLQIAPDLPWKPVLQGWAAIDYLRHLDEYDRRGFDLRALPSVGVGTMCRRQATGTARRLVMSLKGEGLGLHLFGFKKDGLAGVASFLDARDSADSLAWSFCGRRAAPLPGHDRPGPGRPRGHINCANCLEYALKWREELLARMAPTAEAA